MKLTVGRVVALATPVFAAAAGVGSAWLAAHFPGLPHFSPTEITVFLTTGATAGGTAAVKFLHGNSQWERLEHTLSVIYDKSSTEVNTLDPGLIQKLEAALLADGSALEQKLVSVISGLHVTVGKAPVVPKAAPVAAAAPGDTPQAVS